MCSAGITNGTLTVCLLLQNSHADLEQRVLQFLGRRKKPVKPNQIAKSIGLQKALDVNPVLYKLESNGLVVRTSKQPPQWSLVADTNKHVPGEASSAQGMVVIENNEVLISCPQKYSCSQ